MTTVKGEGKSSQGGCTGHLGSGATGNRECLSEYMVTGQGSSVCKGADESGILRQVVGPWKRMGWCIRVLQRNRIRRMYNYIFTI